MSTEIPNGTRKRVDGRERVYYDGYWIRYYEPPEETLAARKELIDHLTRRTFHHTEPGINTPGEKLELARRAYESEQNPARKRVNAAMLAGALFNRASDIFTTVVELAEKGVELKPTNELMRQCGRCFKEALELGKQVKHHSGDEGIDELWGEPLKAFTLPIAQFYASRYVKVANTMRDIDTIAATLVDALRPEARYEGLAAVVEEYATAARAMSETMRSDPETFQVWPRFVAAGERLLAFRPRPPATGGAGTAHPADEPALDLIRSGRALISYLAAARVAMPKSTRAYTERCAEFAAKVPSQPSSANEVA